MKKYLLSIEPKIYKSFRETARKDGRSMRWLIERFMREYVEEKKPKRPKTSKKILCD